MQTKILLRATVSWKINQEGHKTRYLGLAWHSAQQHGERGDGTRAVQKMCTRTGHREQSTSLPDHYRKITVTVLTRVD